MSNISNISEIKLRVITPSEFSLFFHQGMIDRMEVSFHKYGPVALAKGKVDELASLKKRIQKYEDTGNTEWLMDVANFCMIIFMHEGVEKFYATESHESPGLVTTSGVESSAPHTYTPAQVKEELDSFYKGKQE